MASNGIVLIKPSTVNTTGGSASATINAGGSVTFTTCESLSLNDVFSSAYDNYMVVIRYSNSTDSAYRARLRASGSDASGSNYVVQVLSASSTTVSGSRNTKTFGDIGATSSALKDGLTWYLYGPNLAQPTAWRTVEVDGQANALLYDQAVTHSLSTAYDGITIFPNSGSTSGLIKVYGLVQ